MSVHRLVLIATLLGATALTCPAAEGVILLHGLCRTDRSMRKMEAALEAEGYVVVNVRYPSRRATIEELASSSIRTALTNSILADVEKVHFVTHSMGGILVRQYLQSTKVDRLGRIVMLGPPNQGSELVDKLGWIGFLRKFAGPAARQLGTKSDSVLCRLGEPNFELGVIAGDRSLNWIDSWMIRGRDDGKVSVERTKIAGMKDHLVLHATHTFLMRRKAAIRATIEFLREGHFSSTVRHGEEAHREISNEVLDRAIAAR